MKFRSGRCTFQGLNYDDLARFQYGRILWRNPDVRARLLRHWADRRHPYRDRFVDSGKLVREILSSREVGIRLDRRLRARGTSLRAAIREIPPIFGSFWRDVSPS